MTQPAVCIKELQNTFKLLKIIRDDRPNIIQLADSAGFNRYYTEKILGILLEGGLVKKVFGGCSRYIVLTEKGAEFIRGVDE